jgi:phage shock protein PspC (stress-responsive transcriptional regulator)
MNEVNRIHLGRQPYTISAEAHRDLKAYLADIQKEVGDKEVVSEVELRMSELLAERGVTSDKVILPEDVAYLKEQLGTPEDFSGDEEPATVPKDNEQPNRRLFRDHDNALIGGVAAGIASYFGLDVVLVRLAFVLLAIFSGGTGIILYLLLWLVVPPAVTTSEKLQMQGKPVTLEALKESVSKADVPGKARFVNNSLRSVIDGLLRLAVKLVGIGFLLAGLALAFGVIVTKIYMIMHNGQLFQENLFPVGLREQWLLAISMVLALIVAIFLMLTGIATLKRKWPIRGWITGLLVGVFLLGSVAGAALAADAAPRISERYTALMHTTAIKNIQPFNKIVTSGDIDISYVSSPDYAVNIHYADHPDLSKLKVHVANNTLYIDSRGLDGIDHCTMLCLFPRYNMTVEIFAPNIQNFVTPPHTEVFYPDVPPLPSRR